MLTMTSTLERAARMFGARSAIADARTNATWAEHVNRVRRAAAILRSHGLKPGDRFAVMGLNSHLYSEILHAGYWAGLIPVPINHRLAPPEIRQIVDDSGCKLLAHCNAFAKILTTPELAGLKLQPLNLESDYERKLAEAQPAAAHPTRPEDLALLLFTGGTTGRSKGVCLSHANIVSNAMQVALAMRAGPEDRFLHAAPMFHAADLLGNVFTLVGGSHAYLARFTGDGALAALRDRKVTVAMLAPTMIVMILQEPNIASYDLDRLRLIFYGSSPIDAVWVRRAMATFPGVDLQHNYGLTETAPILTAVEPAEIRARFEAGDEAILRAAGRPLAGVDLTLRDDDGNEVAHGEIGEVVVRGPNVAAGYYNRPEETAAAFKNGWFHTGDMGRLDENGLLFLVDRKKDMVITGGENVYTTEVEAAIYLHPDVQEAAVIGVPDEKYGEALFAVIVPAPGKTLCVDDIIEHCRGRIGAYKIPRRGDIVDELPKSAMGKILKTELRRIYAGKTTKF
jgi:long-chain acyl-CoA synthetase